MNSIILNERIVLYLLPIIFILVGWFISATYNPMYKKYKDKFPELRSKTLIFAAPTFYTVALFLSLSIHLLPNLIIDMISVIMSIYVALIFRWANNFHKNI